MGGRREHEEREGEKDKLRVLYKVISTKVIIITNINLPKKWKDTPQKKEWLKKPPNKRLEL